MFSPFCRGITSEIVAKPLNCLTMRMLGVVEEEKQQPTENETKTRKSITDTSMYTIVEQGETTPQKQRGKKKKKHERPIYEPNPTDAYKSCTVSEKAGPSLTHEYQECKSLLLSSSSLLLSLLLPSKGSSVASAPSKSIGQMNHGSNQVTQACIIQIAERFRSYIVSCRKSAWRL